MKALRSIVGAALLATVAAPASASILGDTVLRLHVTNNTAQPMYISSIGAGTYCWKQGIPATSIQPGGTQVFPILPARAASCLDYTAKLQTTVVIGVPGETVEQRGFFTLALTWNPSITGKEDPDDVGFIDKATWTFGPAPASIGFAPSPSASFNFDSLTDTDIGLSITCVDPRCARR